MIDRHFAHFNVAGFTYYDGAEIFNELKIGTELTAVPEPQNTYDALAVALYFKGKKIGFIPRVSNAQISKLLNHGHVNLFDFRINRLKPDAYPEEQVGVVVKIRPLPV